MAEGRPIKAIAVAEQTTPAAIAQAVEQLFITLSEEARTGGSGALRRLRLLHQAIVDREEQGETLSRLLPTGVADKVRAGGGKIGETEELTVTVLMSDVRGYSGIAEQSDPSALAGQLNEHRAAMNQAILDRDGTVMQFIGDAVMACFGAPLPHDAPRAARARHRGRDARGPARPRRGVERARACPRSGSASASPPDRSPRRCSGPRSASSTRSSATP